MDRLEEIRQRVEQLVRIANNPYCLGPAALLDGVKEIVPALLSEVDRLEKGWQEALALANTNARLFDEATARAEAAEAERDAIAKDLRICSIEGYAGCDYCNGKRGSEQCNTCKDGSNWGWRGQEAGKGEAE